MVEAQADRLPAAVVVAEAEAAVGVEAAHAVVAVAVGQAAVVVAKATRRSGSRSPSLDAW